MNKITKAAAGYTHVANQTYECSQCAAYLADQRRCVFHAPWNVINDFGSCNLWLQGGPGSLTVSYPKALTETAESGYTENPARTGYGCAQCANFDELRRDCQLVDRYTPGVDPDQILGDACCNLWQAMKSPKLIQMPSQPYQQMPQPTQPQTELPEAA